MNDKHIQARPLRVRVSQFKSVEDFWLYHTDHPEAFSHMDATGILEMAKKVGERIERRATERKLSAPETPDDKREFQREKTASKNGNGRELNGNSRASRTNGKAANNGTPSCPTSPRTWGEDTGEGQTAKSFPPSEPPNLQTSEPPATGYKNPPAEHRFQPGNPGGPGGQFGPRSMRKYIRMLLFGDEVEAGFAKDVTTALFFQAIRGNTHAIRIICENGNNRRVTKR